MINYAAAHYAFGCALCPQCPQVLELESKEQGLNAPQGARRERGKRATRRKAIFI